MSITFLLAKQNDAKIIHDLAHEIWYEYYTTIITNTQIAYMLDMMYGISKLQEQINSNFYYHIIYNKAEAIGFLALEDLGNAKFYLQKYYLKKAQRANRIGQICFEEIVKLYTMEVLNLAVNRENFKSINFYFKMGFKIVEVVDNNIGNNYFMNDFIMQKNFK